jgi:hypothetical protein
MSDQHQIVEGDVSATTIICLAVALFRQGLFKVLERGKIILKFINGVIRCGIPPAGHFRLARFPGIRSLALLQDLIYVPCRSGRGA